MKAELKKSNKFIYCKLLSKYLTVYSVAILDIVQFFAFKINRNLIATTPILLFYKYDQVK